MMNFVRATAALALVALTVSCTHVSYYLQSMRGQLDIWSKQRDIEAVVENPETSAPLRARLEVVLRIRNFASHELGLPENASYRTYANLGRSFVVWNVFAAPEFDIRPRHWCFIVAGCVNYRGYFDKAHAEDFAAENAAEGYDVFIGGVPAYSLLGYFPDPVLNTFVSYPLPHLAQLIFHELSHQVVYVRDDSEFNESFAVTVEEAGLQRWLARYGSPGDRASIDLMRQRRTDFVKLIQTYQERLAALYRSKTSRASMRAQKAAIFAQMNNDYQEMKAGWGGFVGFDRWFAEKPNNALLASVAIYTKKVPAFQALLAQEGGDLPRFYAAVKLLAGMSKRDRNAALDRLMPSPAGPAANAH